MSLVRKTLQAAAAMSAASMLSGCNLLVLNPAGDIAARQGHLIVVATVLMLIVIVPVIALTFWFAWRYRAANTRATYKPDWDHSTQLELVIWGVPLLIIIALGAVTWIGTHLLDPYRPLGRIGEGRPVPADVKPLEVQVVALDWKWLFVYPEYGVASVNQMAAPVEPSHHLPPDVVVHDERVLRAGAGGDDLHDAGDGDQAPRRHEQGRRVRRILLALQRRGLFAHALPFPRIVRSGLRALDRRSP
ncbi:hypothetical protein [Pseudoxanthomonas mexicana]